METGNNNGLIGIVENRTNTKAMKEYYRAEYKKIVNKEKKSDSDLFRNKWRLRFGTFTARVGLTFHPNGAVKALSKLGTHVFGFAAEKIMRWKNKRDKEKYKKQKERLTADFINLEGDFKQFDIINPAIIEEVENIEEKGFTK